MIGEVLGCCGDRGEDGAKRSQKNTGRTNGTMCNVSFPSGLAELCSSKVPANLFGRSYVNSPVPHAWLTQLRLSKSLVRSPVRFPHGLKVDFCSDSRRNNAFLKWNSALQECQEWRFDSTKLLASQQQQHRPVCDTPDCQRWRHSIFQLWQKGPTTLATPTVWF